MATDGDWHSIIGCVAGRRCGSATDGYASTAGLPIAASAEARRVSRRDGGLSGNVQYRQQGRDRACDTYALATLCEALGTGLPTVLVPMVNHKLWGHPAWSRNIATLRDAGVTLLDVHTGAAGTSPVRSGSGDEVVARFDPAWLTTHLEPLLPR
jgi:hypothetical protein